MFPSLQGIIFAGLCFQGRTELALETFHTSVGFCLVGFFEGLKLLFFFFSLAAQFLIDTTGEAEAEGSVTSCSQGAFTLLSDHPHLQTTSVNTSAVSLWEMSSPVAGWQPWGREAQSTTSDVQQTRVMLRCRGQGALWKWDCEMCVLSPSCNSCHNLCKLLTFLGLSLASLFCDGPLPRILAWGFTLEQHIHFVSCPPFRQTSQGSHPPANK